MDGEYPGYGFARHKGYPTPEHLEALARLGACAIHRRILRAGPGGAGAGRRQGRCSRTIDAARMPDKYWPHKEQPDGDGASRGNGG